MNTKAAQGVQDNHVVAFLQMIRHSEGTAGADGYRTLFGGKLFDSFADHPGLFFNYTNKAGQTIKTSAAGAYQITHTTWAGLKGKLGLPDFSPHSQDMAAYELLSECGAVPLIIAGDITAATDKCRKIWASLPGSGNHQPEHSMKEVVGWYEGALRATSPQPSPKERGV